MHDLISLSNRSAHRPVEIVVDVSTGVPTIVHWGAHLGGRVEPASLTGGGLVLTGRQLEVHGIRPPILHPESAVLFTLTAT
jgi:hypothetical protein